MCATKKQDTTADARITKVNSPDRSIQKINNMIKVKRKLN